ncbi:hypothetical protein V8C43DRAFT_276961 [Trichoderma afarasin]
MAQWSRLGELTRPPAEHTSSSSASGDGNISTPLRPTVRGALSPYHSTCIITKDQALRVPVGLAQLLLCVLLLLSPFPILYME